MITEHLRTAGNEPVKVVPARGSSPAQERFQGYFTTEKYVAGRTPSELEQALGIPRGMYAEGVILLRPDRPLTETDFECKGYSQQPDGREPREGDVYPPGLGVPQWRVREGAEIGVSAQVCRLGPDERAPRMEGAGSQARERWKAQLQGGARSPERTKTSGAP